ncbi:hypothetical protein ACFLU5_14405 [Bacteroidota bacterium]
MTFEEIYLIAAERKDPASHASQVEFEIGSYLLKKLDQGEIEDQELKEKLYWLKAYRSMFDFEIGDY